mmetsp:Transcript_5239/g.5843  ORF Transcript_5239/g.5843 Transcript_5239/m.5843 type:complete len:477 (+) Transcript_5239:100-1530(+)
MTGKRFLSVTSFLLIWKGSSSFAPSGTLRHSTPNLAIGKQRLATELEASVGSRSSLFSFDDSPDESVRANNRHSASDWLHNALTIRDSTVLKEIRHPVIATAVWGAIVSIVHILISCSDNRLVQKLAKDMCIGSAPHSFLVSSLGLLLVFRTNSAYQRFNEGRKIWENILTTSRNFSRMINLYSKEIGEDRRRRLTNLTAAFPYLLRHHIRENCLCESKSDIPQDHRLCIDGVPQGKVETRHEGDMVEHSRRSNLVAQPCWVDKRNLPWSLFDKHSLQKVARAQNRPLWVCDRIGREMMSVPYDNNWTSRERLTLLGQVEKLTNAIGECERIHQTAVPLNYARHSLRSLTLWLFTLPFALIKDLGLLTGPVMAVISWVLFGVYQIGYSIEDPFQGSLRLSILCDAIRGDVLGEGKSRDTAYSIAGMSHNEEVEGELYEMHAMEQHLGSVLLPSTTVESQFILNAPQLVNENSRSWR